MDTGRAVITLARYRARTIIRAQLRSAGHKLTTIRYSDLVARADTYLAQHPELREWAQSAVAELTSGAPRTKP